MSYSTIDKPTDYFNTLLYTGNNGSDRSITGVGFQPDLVWNKNRSASANHNLWNGVTGITQRLTSSGTQASENYSSEFKSFDSDGVTITQNAGSLDINNSSYNYVNWNWLGANGTASNSNGSITSTVSANTTSGFSIVSYTGTGSNATVGHGLGSVVKMFFVKELSNANSWEVYHVSEGAGKNAQLNSNAAFESQGSSRWNSTAPTSTTISIGTDSGVNRSSSNYIAYCFAEKKGYSKFGSYTGNGSTDGTFVYTGFKPAFVLWKRTEDAGYDWDMYDTARDTYNVAFKELMANSNAAESSATVLSLDILSNGFKLRTSNDNGNGSGKPYIYMAFAESPFVGSNFVPNNAR